MKHFFCIFLCVSTIVAFAQKEKHLLREGNNAYFSGKYGEAENYYSEALKEKSTYTKLNYNLGDAYYKQGKYTEAIGQNKVIIPQFF